MSLAVKGGVLHTERSDLSRSFLQVLVGLYVIRNNAESNNQLLQFETDPVAFEREIIEGIYVASGYLNPDATKDAERRYRAQELLIRALVSVYRSLETLSDDEGRLENPAAAGKLLHIIDAVAMRVYHTLDISLSTALAGQAVGIKEVDDGIWLVSFMDYDLGYIDLEEKTLQPLNNPFGPRM